MTIKEIEQALVGKKLKINDGLASHKVTIIKVRAAEVSMPHPQDDLRIVIINEVNDGLIFTAATIRDLIINGKVVFRRYKLTPYEEECETEAYVELLRK